MFARRTTRGRSHPEHIPWECTRRTILLTLLSAIIIVVLPSTTMLAQGPWRARLSPEERTAQLKKALNLSDEQAAKVKAIFEQHDKELRKLFDQKNTGDRSVMREAVRHKAAETDEKILALLNAEQKAKYKQWVQKRRERFQ